MPSVTRKAQGNRAQRRAEIERSLLAATERLMNAGSSFTELSVDRLATEAGVSRATFYIYFEDKGHLLRQLAERVFGELSEAARRWWDVAERRRSSDAREAMQAIVATYRRHQSVITAVIEMAAYDPDVSATYDAIFEGIVANVEAVIRAGRSAGTIRDIPVTETAAALTWMVERSCHQTLRRTPPGPGDDHLAESLAQVIWASLYLEGP
ncbi:TetR/AcrR family transcriptional regulator [Mycobacterium sp. Lab-001]|uniref:TetR/AcrR family transcriptional regulator n=1 Tax=Mycobacterium sp. Lab-001 TaxID=3410136 RepID=UPI003D17BD2B